MNLDLPPLRNVTATTASLTTDMSWPSSSFIPTNNDSIVVGKPPQTYIGGTTICFINETTKVKTEYTTPAYSIRMLDESTCGPFSDPLHGLFALIGELQVQNETLKEQISILEAKLDECYYAPGMPGYLKAKDSYSEIMKYAY